MTSLRRSLTTFDVVALGLNGVIGSGIFLLPGIVAEAMGPASILATVFGGFLCLLIALCFAEMGSRVSGTGGAYLYAREAFGEFVGFEVGWITWCVRIIGSAALVNGLVTVVAHFLPGVAQGLAKAVFITATLFVLAAINVRGTKLGATVINALTVAKLLPLIAFVLIGVFSVEPELYQPFSPKGYGDFGKATLIILWAYVGFEGLVIPSGEIRDPQRTVPMALVLVMSVVTVVYIGVQGVAMGTLPTVAGAENPVADASRVFLGDAGATLIAACIVASLLGVNAGTALITPRCGYALAEKGNMPEALGWIHPTFGTPWVAIVVSTAVAWVLALSGSFEQLAVISVVARFAQYVPTCAAVLVLRGRGGDRPSFQIPLGPAVPVAAMVLSAWLVSEAEAHQLWSGAAALGLGAVVFVLFRKKGSR